MACYVIKACRGYYLDALSQLTIQVGGHCCVPGVGCSFKAPDSCRTTSINLKSYMGFPENFRKNLSLSYIGLSGHYPGRSLTAPIASQRRDRGGLTGLVACVDELEVIAYPAELEAAKT